MTFKYKLIEKLREPGNPTAGKNWRGAPSSATSLSGKAMTRAATKNTTTRAATKNTTMAPIELEAALDLLADFIPEQLLQGHTVTIPGLGYFRLTFKSKGSDTVEGFDPKEMLYDVRPVFVVDKAFRKRVQDGIEFEDGGVQKDGISYATRMDYLQATNPGGTTTQPGGSETGGSEPGSGDEDSFG